jgi:hypothetical protein
LAGKRRVAGTAIRRGAAHRRPRQVRGHRLRAPGCGAAGIPTGRCTKSRGSTGPQDSSRTQKMPHTLRLVSIIPNRPASAAFEATPIAAPDAAMAYGPVGEVMKAVPAPMTAAVTQLSASCASAIAHAVG